MRYRLRTLLILLAIGPPLLTGAWWATAKWQSERKWPKALVGVEYINGWPAVPLRYIPPHTL